MKQRSIDLFWAKVKKGKGPNACWLWTRSLTGGGHGNFQGVVAHRISWELANGPIPRGLQVLHDCPGGDNPKCVNPRHLWLGNQEQNLADMVAKGRAATGLKNGTHTHPERRVRGKHWYRTHPCKLTESLVNKLRYLYDTKILGVQISYISVTRKLGINSSTLYNILHRRTW